MSTQPSNLAVASYNPEPVNPGTVITRSIMVNITGSLANLAMAGPQAAIWKPVEGKQIHVFGMGSDVDANVVTNQLRTALIHEVTLLEHRSTFPVAMGVKVDCVPEQEMTDLGDKFAYTVLPMSNISSPHTVYKCDVSAEEGHQWRKEYPNYTNANLESEGVLPVANCAYVFVNQNHPIIALLRANASLIGCNIDEQVGLLLVVFVVLVLILTSMLCAAQDRRAVVQGESPGAGRVLPDPQAQGPVQGDEQRPELLPAPAAQAQLRVLGRHQ